MPSFSALRTRFVRGYSERRIVSCKTVIHGCLWSSDIMRGRWTDWWWSPYLSKQCLSGQAGSPSSPVRLISDHPPTAPIISAHTDLTCHSQTPSPSPFGGTSIGSCRSTTRQLRLKKRPRERRPSPTQEMRCHERQQAYLHPDGRQDRHRPRPGGLCVLNLNVRPG